MRYGEDLARRALNEVFLNALELAGSGRVVQDGIRAAGAHFPILDNYENFTHPVVVQHRAGARPSG